MSFKYKGALVTMNNYIEVFNGLESDLLDEIRSAVLDDTPIAPFIKYCLDDSYKLGQFRKALREYVPKEYLNPRLSGSCVYILRQCYRNGVDLSPIKQYVKSNLKLDNNNLENVLKVLLAGGDIRKVDFTIIPDDNIEVICEGLIKGYPMWLCISTEGYLTPSFIRQLMKGMKLNIDIHPFLNGKWTEEQLVVILSNSKAVNVNELLEYVNYKFTIEHLVEIIDCSREGCDYTPLCLQDEDGSPSFNPYQLGVLRRCIKEDVLIDEIYNPNINDMEMEDMFNEMLEKREKERKPILSGVLKNKNKS